MGYWRVSVPDDAHKLAPRLRELDRQELQAAHGKNPLCGLLSCLEISATCLTGCDGVGEPIMMFGLNPHPGGVAAIVWMLATPEIETLSNAKSLARYTESWLEMANEEHPILYNTIDERHTVNIRWLKRVGFQFINRRMVAGRPYLDFVRIKQCAGLLP